MPILSEPGYSILEEANRARKIAEIVDQESIGRVKSLRVFDSGFEPEQPGTRSLQLDVAAGAQLVWWHSISSTQRAKYSLISTRIVRRSWPDSALGVIAYSK